MSDRHGLVTWIEQLAEVRDTDWSEATVEQRLSKSAEITQMSGYAAAAAAVVPIPMADLALLLPIHTALVMTVGHVYGRSVSRAEAARVAAELGAVAGWTFAGTAALSALRKVVLPGLGGVLAAPAAFGLTWALGRASEAYFDDPELSREELRKVFKDAIRDGKSMFSSERFDTFRARYGQGKDVVPDAEPPEAEPKQSSGEGDAVAPDTPPPTEAGARPPADDEDDASRDSGERPRGGGRRL